MAEKFNTRTEGLDVYVHMAKTFADTPWLHYGLWAPDERVVVPNIRHAQERYVDRLVGMLPAPPARVFDIGGGTGALAALLVSRGYEVEMLTPSSVQIETARQTLGPDVPLHHMRFEDYAGPGGFDVLLFSESFQYVPLSQSLPRLEGLLKPDGVVVIADCFRSEAWQHGVRAPGGGHRYAQFLAAVEAHGLEIVEDHDVTGQVAPTMIIDQNFYREFLAPLVVQLDGTLRRTRPVLRRFLGWGYWLMTSKKSRDKMQARLKADYRSPEHFARFNTYRFLVLKPR